MREIEIFAQVSRLLDANWERDIRGAKRNTERQDK